jgi:hypothetical protein
MINHEISLYKIKKNEYEDKFKIASEANNELENSIKKLDNEFELYKNINREL